MSDVQPATPGGDNEPSLEGVVNLVEQIVEAALSDARVTQTVSVVGVDRLRELMLATNLARPDEVVVAANHEEQSGETA